MERFGIGFVFHALGVATGAAIGAEDWFLTIAMTVFASIGFFILWERRDD